MHLYAGILLQARRELDAGRTSPRAAVRRFYLRRVLRIFPVYYLVLAIAWAGNVTGAREGIAWHEVRNVGSTTVQYLIVEPK